MSRKKQRQQEGAFIREEGRKAFLNGKHIQSNPYKRTSIANYYWRDGFVTEQENQERSQHD